ncbi:DUF3617 domain-containing protein [Sphingomonas pruni]|uniref:DUF3617 domain-containing protein n=1 Tax=Sphingomonas pruni TaxID=40683 RepID=UPI000834BE02|nr:DUF3617 domain-containing protein [Sphingomonas pruni]
MRTTPLVLAATATLALAACGEKTSSTTITTNSATGTVTTTGDAPPTVASLRMQPGKWETTITTLETKTSGLPAGMPAGMTPPKPAPQTITACVTPEQATKGPGEMLKNAKVDCTIKNSTFTGGRIASEASCKLPNGTMTMNTTGSYSPTEVTYDTEAAISAGPVSSTTKTHTVSRRIGECS